MYTDRPFQVRNEILFLVIRIPTYLLGAYYGTPLGHSHNTTTLDTQTYEIDRCSWNEWSFRNG